jgi:hypothetical protein
MLDFGHKIRVLNNLPYGNFPLYKMVRKLHHRIIAPFMPHLSSSAWPLVPFVIICLANSATCCPVYGH